MISANSILVKGGTMVESSKIIHDGLATWDKIQPFQNTLDDEDPALELFIDDATKQRLKTHEPINGYIQHQSSSNGNGNGHVEGIRSPEQQADGPSLIFKRNESESPLIHPTPIFGIDDNINSKLVFWIGDVWRLDTDAIIYPNNTHLSDRSGSAGPIFTLGGREMMNDIQKQGNECRIGEAIITQAGRLPARYVVHTTCPTYNAKYMTAAANALNSCYRSSLELVMDSNNSLKTVGISCVHTDTRSFPPVLGAHIALRTIRRYLERHSSKFDKVVLCLENIIDIENYKQMIQIYFPRSKEELLFQQLNLPLDYGDENGEQVTEDRKIRIPVISSNLFRNFDDDYQETEEDDKIQNQILTELNETYKQELYLCKKEADPDNRLKKNLDNLKLNPQEKTQQLFEYYLNLSRETDLSNIAKLNFIYQSTDLHGKPLVVIIGSHLDIRNDNLEHVLLYLIRILEGVCFQEYSVIYFHSNMSSKPLPDLSWLKKVLEIFEYKYSKNLTTFYIVHPTFFLKTALLLLKPFSQEKILNRISYHDSFRRLYKNISLGKLNIPKSVINFEIDNNNITDFEFQDEDTGL